MEERKDPGADPAAEPSFEQALEALEGIVEELESGGLTLEQSIARYEEGVRLSQRLTRSLDDAERRIERLVAGEGERTPRTAPMEIDDDPAGGPGAAGRPGAEAERRGPPRGHPAARRGVAAAREERPPARTPAPPDPDELPF